MPIDYTLEALREARKGQGRTSPNPAVGALLVADGEIVGRGHHIYAAKDHAEIVALAQAGEKARGATLYITLEPCSHRGRTGPCADALAAAGVAKVVAAMEDPNPLVAGRGFAKLRAAGIAVEIDRAHSREAETLNEPFCFFMRERRPLVTLKSALTLDGKIAAPDDNEGWITSERARAHVQQLRHLSDAIVTGIGTVDHDDCLLTDRTELPRARPLLRIVLDSQLRIRTDSQMVRSAANDVLIVTTSAASAERREALEKAGVEVAVLDGADGRTNMRALIELLAARDMQSLMIEAGSKVNGAALDSGIVDKIFFYYAPKMFGGLQSLPVAGGRGRRRRADAMLFENVQLHPMSDGEFAVEAWLKRGPRA
jgi:diaminohydroxyphosphoribosylaminopyrimidine deaminase/5-amino-6-(5-phosphoribosylamino)uracil reductase